jgi:hypothetical protein
MAFTGLGAAAGALSKNEKARQLLGNYANFIKDSAQDWGQNIGRAKEQVGAAFGQVGDALFPTPIGASGQLIESDNPLLRSQGQANLNRTDVGGALFPSPMNRGGKSQIFHMPPPQPPGLSSLGGVAGSVMGGPGDWDTYRQHLERLSPQLHNLQEESMLRGQATPVQLEHWRTRFPQPPEARRNY